VIGIRESNRVLIAADSAVDFGTHIDTCPDKVFRTGEFVVGESGHALLGQAVRYALRFRAVNLPLHLLAAKVIGPKILRLRDELAQYREELSGEYIFARGGELVTITEFGEVFTPARDYVAIGSGSSFAYGSLRNSKGSALKRATEAICTAAEFLGDVAPPVVHMWTVGE
jgi:ATP-dependent protease HslVU (ClpYQ) peptidase subunit